MLDLPNSFTKDDGIRRRFAFTYLLMENPGQVVLRPAHWNVSIEDLLGNMPDSVPPHQALPVHVNAKRARMDGEAAADRFSDQVLPVLFRSTSPKREVIACSRTWSPVI